MKHPLFTGYGALVLLLFAVATHQGYTWSGLFGSAVRANKSSTQYHK
ncbi:MAG: hypothetical protein V4735_06115 [Pseudomonadota bacterium]